MTRVHRPEVIAHRGTPREHPENTMPSFLRALELGADAVELDVHATSDGVVVVHHDPVLHGIAPRPELAGRRIADLSATEVARFRVDGDVAIPTLDAVLDAIGDRAMVYVEIKGRRIEQAVVDCVRRSKTRSAIHCFDHRVVRRVHEIAPELDTGILIAAYLLEPGEELQRVGARDYWLERQFVDEEVVRRVHGVGGRVIAWTVNHRAEAEVLAGMGVDGICTDDMAEVFPVVTAVA